MTNPMRPILWMTAGVLAGIALVLACGDDNSTPADAAKPDAAKPDAPVDATETCDCKGFEPAITPGRIYRERGTFKPSAGDKTASLQLACKPGDVVLGGGCYTFEDGVAAKPDQSPVSAGPEFPVLVSGPMRYYDTAGEITETREGWQCVWGRRVTASDVHHEITAICLDVKPD